MTWLHRILLLLLGLGFVEAYAWVFVPKIHVGPSFKEFDETLGLRMKRSARGTRYARDYTMRWTTGAQGYRGETVPPEKPAGVRRVVSLGNSHAFGVGVDDDETYAALADAALGPDVHVINAASTDAGTGTFLRRWDELVALDPDLLVVRYDHYNFKVPTAQYRQDEAGVPVPKGPRSERALGRIYSLIDSGPLAYSAALALARWRVNTVTTWSAVALCRLPRLHTAGGVDPCLPVQESHDTLELTLLDRLLALSREARVPVLVLLFDLRGEEREAAVRARLAERAVLDFTDQHERDGMTFPLDGHMSEAAHAETASALVGWIEARQRR